MPSTLNSVAKPQHGTSRAPEPVRCTRAPTPAARSPPAGAEALPDQLAGAQFRLLRGSRAAFGRSWPRSGGPGGPALRGCRDHESTLRSARPAAGRGLVCCTGVRENEVRQEASGTPSSRPLRLLPRAPPGHAAQPRLRQSGAGLTLERGRPAWSLSASPVLPPAWLISLGSFAARLSSIR